MVAQTKLYRTDMINSTRSGGFDDKYGFRPPQPMHQVQFVSSAGYNTNKRDPFNPKESFEYRTQTPRRMDPIDPLELHPAYREIPPKGPNNSGVVVGTAFGFY